MREPCAPPIVADVIIFVSCSCGAPDCHEVELEQDEGAGWSVKTEDRYILCETCDQLIDAGMRFTAEVKE
jgi:hypothetical protein